jgi:hydroxyethylthiazole kinase
VRAEAVLRKLGEDRPLVHHLTNYVTVNLAANVTRCTGALPVMAHSVEEVEEMVSAASALVLNIGTLDPPWVEAMLRAGRKANELEIPVVLDPVGAGATRFRTQTAEHLLSELEFAAICGNAGEIATLAGLSGEVRGVESIAGDPLQAVKLAAQRLSTTVAATGPTDYLSDGERALAVENGHPLMGRIVGTGCAATATIGCFAAAGGGGAETVAGALAYLGRAGELAAESAAGPGTFEPLLLDALAELAVEPDGLEADLRIKDA